MQMSVGAVPPVIDRKMVLDGFETRLDAPARVIPLPEGLEGRDKLGTGLARRALEEREARLVHADF